MARKKRNKVEVYRAIRPDEIVDGIEYEPPEFHIPRQPEGITMTFSDGEKTWYSELGGAVAEACGLETNQVLICSLYDTMCVQHVERLAAGKKEQENE